MGESGGGGISVPSVKEKVTGVSAGRVNRPLGLPLAGIISCGRSQLLYCFSQEGRMCKPTRIDVNNILFALGWEEWLVPVEFPFWDYPLLAFAICVASANCAADATAERAIGSLDRR
jgi:hypothetical protein